jgi:DNA polymerase III epsilon subunit-like protein
MRFSDEQAHIIDLCRTENNVIVDAVAGSGKTTTLLGIADSNKRMLAVLYNKSLKKETRQRAAQRELALLEIHTYHALARKYYNNTVKDDTGITKVIKDNKQPLTPLPKWERIIVDEVQDMNPLYFSLVKKIINDLANPNLRITVMGDRYQSVYAFLGADARFLTHADKIYKQIEGDWINASLSTTYRCSPSICTFINEGLLGYNRMIPAEPEAKSAPVHYIYGSPFDAHRLLTEYITTFLDQGFKPDDIFVLTSSTAVKGRDTPTRVLENSLVAHDIPVYVSHSGDHESGSDDNNENAMTGKLVITTFHRSKGLERDIVIVYNFDKSYFFNKPELEQQYLSSPQYVAITRARKFLFLVHDQKQPPLPCFRPPCNDCITYLTTYGTVLDDLPECKAPAAERKSPTRVFVASEMTNFLPVQAILEAKSFLTCKTLKQADMKVIMPLKVQTKINRWEEVADINGLAIPALYEWRRNKIMQIANVDEFTVLKQNEKYAMRYFDLRKQIQAADKDPVIDTVLELANIYSSFFNGYHYKIAQITKYNWLSTSLVEPCLEILGENISAVDVQYEKPFAEQIFYGATIRGQADAYSEAQSTLWELKCTESLELVHEIQLAIYAWLYKQSYPRRFQEIGFHLLNIRTGELKRISATAKQLDDMMVFLITEKTRPLQKISDAEFISENAKKFETAVAQQTIPEMMKLGKKTESPMRPEHEHAQANFVDDLPRKKVMKQTLLTPLPVIETNVVSEPAKMDIDASTEQNKGAQAAGGGRVIVFDLETNGLPETPSFGKYHPPSDLSKYRTARIVQWSWALYEADGTLVQEEDHIIRPNPAEYRIMNAEFHGITDAKARVQGKAFEDVLKIWVSHLETATTMVGHNVNFDKHVLLSELIRREYNADAQTLEGKIWICTMERAKAMCGLKARNKLKPPKLAELMHALGIVEEAGRSFHNAKHDVYYTAKCYFAEQVVKNSCPKMYEGKYAGKTYEEILVLDRPYAINALAVCNVRKLYTSPLRKLSNWMKELVKTDPVMKAEVDAKEKEIREMTSVTA